MTNERRRARRPWIIVALLVAMGAAVTWFAMRGSGGDGDATGAAPGGTDAGSSAGTKDGSAAAPPASNDATVRGGAGSADGSAAGSKATAPASDGAISQGDRMSLRRPEPAMGGAVESPPGPPALPAPKQGGAPPASEPNGGSKSAAARPEERPSNVPDREVIVTPEPLSKAIALSQRDPLEARRQLTAMVSDARLSPAERAKAREAAGAISAAILLSTTIVPGDPYARSYVVQSGDSLARIARSQGIDADWRLLKRVNGIADEGKLRAGQTLKLVPGAFHAIVDKSDFRMDLFLGEGPQRVFVASLPVGLGEYNSTPTGRFKVRPRSKLIDPAWTNPRTGEHHKSDDPANPIGEHWIGIQGIDESNAAIEGYGIHGTVEPGSIGHQASMGCVRMGSADIALVYELLTEPNSTVTIVE